MVETPLFANEHVAAAFWAMRHMPSPPGYVQQARKAHADLWGRITSQPFRELTRDEKRLDRRYQAVTDAYEAEVLTAYHEARAAERRAKGLRRALDDLVGPPCLPSPPRGPTTPSGA